MTGEFQDAIWETVPTQHRHHHDDLAELIPDFVDGAESVLDLGCGDGRHLQQLGQNGAKVIGADRSQVALERAVERAPQAQLVLVPEQETLAIEDNSIDCIWSVGAIEHVVDTQTVLSEARRVLRPGGKLLIATPAHTLTTRIKLALSGWDRHFDPFSSRLRFYTGSSLRKALDDCGFDVAAIEKRGELLVARAGR
jgi:SAM-dependent methyltransferase